MITSDLQRYGMRLSSAFMANLVKPIHNRHAVRDQLRSPPNGFVDVVHKHFKLLRPVLLETWSKWMAEADPAGGLREQFETVGLEIQALLQQLESED